MTEDRKIIVFYLGVADMDYKEVEQYVKSVQQRFFTEEFIKNNNCEILLIPTREINSRIDCINPVYITDKELIDEHESIMKKFNESLNNFIVEYKK